MILPSKAVDQDGLVAFAQRLVHTPSVSTHEGDVAALVVEEMCRVQFTDVRVDRMGNVIGHIGSGAGPKLLLDAHMDVVAVSDPSAWQYPPFGGEIHGGMLYGRGAVDMKGALAAMVYAGKAIVESGQPLGGDVYVVAVVQEEPCEGAAIRHVIENGGLRPDWVVLGEPTNLQIARGHRGRIEFAMTVQGRSSHAASPARGTNAIYEAARVIVGLELLAPQLSQDSFLGKGTIAVTEICSRADSRNAIPDTCVLSIDRRLTAAETEAKAMAELRRILSQEGVNATIEVPEYRQPSYTGYEVAARQHFPYWSTPDSEPLLLTALASIESVLGAVPRLGKWDFSTDGVYTAGVAGIPTIGFGPGDEQYAHAANEQIALKDLYAAARVYADLALRLLGRR